jgi:6-pyruvoyltetrahydropterin/6-carboxytetrahydropterin synthase
LTDVASSSPTPASSRAGSARLARAVRLTLLPPGHAGDDPVRNGYAGFPAPAGLAAFVELIATVEGAVDPNLGYLLDIQAIDKPVRDVALPILTRAMREGRRDIPGLLRQLAAALREQLPNLHLLRLNASPYVSFEVTPMNPPAPAPVVLRTKFDFAAAHRLHAENLSDEENRRIFGKCNNPRGHGHNYQFEPAVRTLPGKDLPIARVYELAERVILQRFDHKHLNEDCPEFDPRRGGLNPSVENIARVFYELLAPEVRTAGAHLDAVTVWETDRTCATYPA